MRLTLISQTELPNIQHELLANQEGFVIRLSRPMRLVPEEVQHAKSLLLIPTEEREGTSILVLSGSITGLKKIEESNFQVSFSMVTLSTEVAKYYGAKDQEHQKVMAAVQKAEAILSSQNDANSAPTQDPLPQSSSTHDGPQATSRDNRLTTHGRADSDLPPPLRLSGSLGVGYYHAETINGTYTVHDTVLNNIQVNLSGYWRHPRVLTYEFKPRLSFGRQSSETILPDGQGFTVSSTFLGGSAFPFTVSYSRLRRQLVTFGTLDRLAGLEADSSQSTLSMNWQVIIPRMPQFDISFSRYNDIYDPLAAITSKIENSARIFSIQLRDKRWGWDWNSELRFEGSTTSLLNVVDPKQKPFEFTRHVKDFRASGSREFAHWLSVDLFGGRSISKNSIDNRPFDQDFSYFYGNVRFRAGEKLSALLRGGIVSNLVGYQLAQILPSGTGQKPLSLPRSGATIFEIGRAHATLFTVSGQVQYELTKDLRLDGELTHNATRAPDSQTILSSNTNLTTLSSGLGYARRFRWWQVQARYSAYLGRFEFGAANRSRMLGHNGSGSMTVGSPEKAELTLSVQGNRQNTSGSSALWNKDFGGGISLSRNIVPGFNLRASFTLDRNLFDSSGVHFEATQKGWAVTMTHRRGEFSYTYQARRGLTFQPDFRLMTVSPAQALNLIGAFPNFVVIPSNYYWTGFNASLNPMKRMTARVRYGWNQQLLGGRKRNQYTQWEAELSYQFRLLTVDFGYLSHEQEFDSDKFSRSRLYFRVVREFQAF